MANNSARGRTSSKNSLWIHHWYQHIRVYPYGVGTLRICECISCQLLQFCLWSHAAQQSWILGGSNSSGFGEQLHNPDETTCHRDASRRSRSRPRRRGKANLGTTSADGGPSVMSGGEPASRGDGHRQRGHPSWAGPPTGGHSTDTTWGEPTSPREHSHQAQNQDANWVTAICENAEDLANLLFHTVLCGEPLGISGNDLFE